MFLAAGSLLSLISACRNSVPCCRIAVDAPRGVLVSRNSLYACVISAVSAAVRDPPPAEVLFAPLGFFLLELEQPVTARARTIVRQAAARRRGTVIAALPSSAGTYRPGPFYR